MMVLDPRSSHAGTIVNAGAVECALTTALISADETSGTSPGIVNSVDPAAAKRSAAAVTAAI